MKAFRANETERLIAALLHVGISRPQIDPIPQLAREGGDVAEAGTHIELVPAQQV
jgi:hypothetical protein